MLVAVPHYGHRQIYPVVPSYLHFMSSNLFWFISWFFWMQYKEELLKFLVVLVLPASGLWVLWLLVVFQHQAAKEVTLAIYFFLSCCTVIILPYSLDFLYFERLRMSVGLHPSWSCEKWRTAQGAFRSCCMWSFMCTILACWACPKLNFRILFFFFFFWELLVLLF